MMESAGWGLAYETIAYYYYNYLTQVRASDVETTEDKGRGQGYQYALYNVIYLFNELLNSS